jgi:hypothetical protein
MKRLGQDVKITVKPTRKEHGEMEVVAAELAGKSSPFQGGGRRH